MESHPLNLAHQQHRRAEAHLANNRYDEAMQCHQNAAEFLLDAMKSTRSSVALESITLQHSYHLKQKDLIKIKKEQYARIKKSIDKIKWLSKDPFSNLQPHDYPKLQIAIYKAISETDTLLNALNQKGDMSNNGLKYDVVDGKKIEKTEQTCKEELLTINKNLHAMVEQLIVQLEYLKDENATMKEKITYLERERARYLNLPGTSDIVSLNNFTPLNVVDYNFAQDTSIQKNPIIHPSSRPVNETEKHYDY